MNKMERHTLAVLTDNEPGVLSRVARLFSGKGYIIQSLSMGDTQDPSVSRITIELNANESQIQLVASQLRKLICVHSVKLLSPGQIVQRELMLIKVSTAATVDRSQILKIADQMNVSVVDESADTITLAAIGDEQNIQAIQQALSGFSILELVRTGVVALEKGSTILEEQTKEKEEYDYGKNPLGDGGMQMRFRSRI